MQSNHPEGPPHPPADVSDRSGQTLGDFVLLRQLGAGGMGQVYLAEQASLKRRVAVKILRSDLASNEISRKRFRAEAEAVARLSHANIVQLYQFHDETTPHYMVLEYVDGRNLRDYLARKGPPDLPLALSIIWQVTSALQQAAELGIVHRDIKPENILLTKKGEVKVADFGLSRMLLANSDAKHLTQTGITMGTPLYMAPEQVEGKPTDHRTDIYSLGVTCYHLLAGQPPFEGENAFAVALQHVQREPVPLEAMRPDLPPALCALVHKMLAKKPEDRPQSAGEILRQLKLLTENTPGTPGEVALSALNLPLAPNPIDPDDVYAGTKTAATSRPPRQGGWLLWPALVVGSLALALGGGALTAMALRPPPEEPDADRPEAPNSTTLETLLGSYKRKERGYRDLIEETESPGKERENLRRGIQHRIDLGLLYLDQVPRDLDRAEELFAAQMKSKVREYEHIGRLGMAMVHAFRDEPEQSNQLLLESLAQARESGLQAMGPNLRWLRMLLSAMDYNKRNCQAQKLRYPPELLAYEAALRRVPGVPPVTPPSIPEKPRQP